MSKFTLLLMIISIALFSALQAGEQEYAFEQNPNPGGGEILTPSIEALWDLQVSFNLEVASGALGNAGAEFDGTYFYTTRWASNLLHQYDLTGNLIQEFSIPGVTGLRDLAYDGTYFYGGAAANTIYIMDFTTQTLVGTIASPEGVRHIAYDSANDAFWVGNWTTDLYLVDRSGNTLATIPAATHALTSVYGSAYDEYSAGGPYLWLFHQGVSGAEAHVAQIDLATGTQTGVTHDMLVDFPSTSPLAGGLWVNTGVASGKASIGGVAQGTPDMFFALELTDAANWVSVNPLADTVAVGDTVQVMVTFDATGLISGLYEADVHVNSNDPVTPTVTVDASLHVTGVPNIAVDPAMLDFGFLFLGVADTMTFAVQNPGTADLTVSGMTTSTSEFTVLTATPFTVVPGGSQDVDVVYLAATSGVHTDSVVITHDAPVGTDVVQLTGETANPPVMALSDTLMQHQMNQGEEDSTTMIIYNNGASTLDYELMLGNDPFVEASNYAGQAVDPSVGYSKSVEMGPVSDPGLAPSHYTGEAIWDVQLTFNLEAASGALGNAGAEFDGTHFYTTRWASNLLHQYDMAGNLVQEFSVSGVTGLRDLAFDGTYFYGGAAANTIYVMDFASQSLVGTITSPEGVRHIAYNEDLDAFYVGNWSTDIYLVDRSGNTLSTIPAATHGITSIYGSAYDNISDGGPYLWVFHQGASGTEAHMTQLDLATGTPTGVTHDVLTDLPASSPLAGGLFITTDFVAGKATIGGVAQGTPDNMICYELAEAASWVTLDHTMGSVAPGDSGLVWVYWHGVITEQVYDGYLGVYSNDPVNPVMNVHLNLEVIPTGIGDELEILPTKYALHQNFPNPFNPSTTIKYDLKAKTDVTLTIFNVLGQKVRTLVNANQTAGYQKVVWDGLNEYGEQVSTGVYIYRIEAGDFVKARKMVFMK